jgi:AraC-like DNA-binding protein
LTNTKFKFSDILFLAPIVLTVVLISPFYLLKTSQKLEILKEGAFYDVAWISPNFIWLEILLMLFYGILIVKQFGRGKISGFKENKWLNYLVLCYFGFVFAFFSYIFLVRFKLMNPKFDFFIDIVIVSFIAILAFFAFFQPEIFKGKSFREVIPFIKYKKTGLSDALAIELKNKLVQIMQEKKPYLNNELRLNDLASDLNLSRNHTSQIINQYFNLSFFDFVNKYRINDAKKLLIKSDNNSTITQIAYDVGFNNRASFYKAFKKFEGLNPTQYLQPLHAS